MELGKDGEPILTFEDLDFWLSCQISRSLRAPVSTTDWEENESRRRDRAIIRRIKDCLDELEMIHEWVGATEFRPMQYTHPEFYNGEGNQESTGEAG